eukprot:scaffold61528_cov29-Tisochrysis_lutea.AAC.1
MARHSPEEVEAHHVEVDDDEGKRQLGCPLEAGPSSSRESSWSWCRLLVDSRRRRRRGCCGGSDDPSPPPGAFPCLVFNVRGTLATNWVFTPMTDELVGSSNGSRGYISMLSVLLWSGVNREPRYRFYGLEDLLCVAGHLAKWVEFSRCFPHSLQSAVFCGRRGEAISRARSPVGDVFEV